MHPTPPLFSHIGCVSAACRMSNEKCLSVDAIYCSAFSAQSAGIWAREQEFDEAVMMVDCSSAYETLPQALARQIRFVFSKLEVISEVLYIYIYIYRNGDSSQICTAR